tara:strand:+ start:69 stop:458 length:390 start_codon:yes stop_codon:yes gene_type:complete
MGYAKFVLSAGKWALGKQKYLNKVWQEATKGGKVVLESHFPKLLSKAKNYYNEFKGFTPKVVPKEKSFIELMKEKGHKFLAKDTPEYLAHIKKTKPKRPSNIIPFPKKPPGKADGGRIDKPLPTRSRDI